MRQQKPPKRGVSLVWVLGGSCFCAGLLLGFTIEHLMYQKPVHAEVMQSHTAQGTNSNTRSLPRALGSTETSTSKVSEEDSIMATAHHAVGKAAAGTGSQHKWPGDTIHTLFTSSGDGYQNYQTRILWGTYNVAKKMPGGEKLTGFTRILHRTVPDVLMDEIPTFHAPNTRYANCDDGACEYPVANRPTAIRQFFEAAAKNSSLVQGAWMLMIETDYVVMRPHKAPGDAYDPSVPGAQFYYDYIMPQHPDAVPWIQKLLGPGKDIKTVPASGPAPVMLRLQDWLTIIPDYEAKSIQMEQDGPMKKQLGWVREMYAWDVAVAMHPEIKILTQKPPDTILIVQPPFDEGLGNASMCHYTWAVQYKDKNEKRKDVYVYRWEKRDFTDMKYVLKVPVVPTPPDYTGVEPWLLPFDAPLNMKRHKLNCEYIAQVNKGIATLPDLTEHYQKFTSEILPAW
eukprot:CAMPEP_0202895500 /NCGR_PEP_ID=MMETSP1392-20130828/4679_1 /ASSEMBLY_ACC=CAM_ASM_000868 /TAXON_ID=225041 /ORGANISM="Chlamydomonas chlamydogama, Strain SAG 11-48b" /LENGTH=453 /DNA_ID=CAMNT_0049580525 /DNA_START=68 /DNA_END=1426 /DNA_ORIENTATION=+